MEGLESNIPRKIEQDHENTETKFEGLLYEDKFHQDIESLEEALAFKKFLEERWKFISGLEKQAEDNYKKEPRLKEYITLRDEASAANEFMMDNLDFGSEEYKVKEKEIQTLDSKAQALLDQDPELKALQDKLNDAWQGRVYDQGEFLRETEALRKVKVIDKVLVPYFEQQEEVNYFENIKLQELNKTRDELYVSLDQDAGNREIETRIEATEDEIKNLPRTIEMKKRRLELMKHSLDEAARKMMSSII
jgi:hypothetical protein